MFESSARYAVFSTVAKAGLGVGGAFDTGVLFEKAKATGTTRLCPATFGYLIGAHGYWEIIFFENETAFAQFNYSHFAFSAQVSAVALESGGATTAVARSCSTRCRSGSPRSYPSYWCC